jgi:hypothetical protein
MVCSLAVTAGTGPFWATCLRFVAGRVAGSSVVWGVRVCSTIGCSYLRGSGYVPLSFGLSVSEVVGPFEALEPGRVVVPVLQWAEVSVAV